MRAALNVSRSLLHERPPGASLLRDMLAQELAAESGEVDLLIRTGGEKRLSDFLLWECAYAELHFVECFWPDFDTAAFAQAIDEYAKRERRFGQVSASDENRVRRASRA